MGFADDFLPEMYREACPPVDCSGENTKDPWLRVFDAQDVNEWGKYLAKWLPNALPRFDRLQGEEFMW